MDLDDRGVDHRKLHVRIIRYGVKKTLEDIALHPIAKALEDRVPLAEKFGKSRQGLAVRALNKKPIVGAPLRPGSLGFPKQCRSIFAHWRR